MKTFGDLTTALQAKFPELGSRTGLYTAQVAPNFATTVLPEKAIMTTPRLSISAERSTEIMAAVREALETAAALEFATIPPYLTALWSIIDQQDIVARSIRTIAHEEMLHLALVNNLIAALKGRPRLTASYAPQYPGSLPGGLHPELIVSLQGLNDESIGTFLEIERPEVVVTIDGIAPPPVPDEDPTIGSFYETVRAIVHQLSPDFDTARQIAGPLAPMVLNSLSDMDDAIDLIREQGEGSTGIPFDTGPDDLSHFYRFRELSLGRHLLWQPLSQTLALGEQISKAETYQISPPPKGGYGDADPPEIQRLSGAFNLEYSRMLEALEDAWGSGGHSSLLKAIELMFQLRPIAQSMMATVGADGKGFAPEFRYVAPKHRL